MGPHPGLATPRPGRSCRRRGRSRDRGRARGIGRDAGLRCDRGRRPRRGRGRGGRIRAGEDGRGRRSGPARPGVDDDERRDAGADDHERDGGQDEAARGRLRLRRDRRERAAVLPVGALWTSTCRTIDRPPRVPPAEQQVLDPLDLDCSARGGPNGANARARSAMSAKRSPGAFSRQRMTTASSPGGRLERRSPTRPRRLPEDGGHELGHRVAGEGQARRQRSS